MDIPKNSDKFKKDEEKIKSKIESVEKEINEDLSLIPEYQLLTVYDKINKILNENERKFSILKKKFLFKDKTLTGYLNLRDFRAFSAGPTHLNSPRSPPPPIGGAFFAVCGRLRA